MPANPLAPLGQALAAAGWCYGWPGGLRHDGRELLRVWHPSVPVFGESVSVRPGPDGRAWFWSSTLAPLAPCDDVPAARDAVMATLAPYVAAATTP